MWHPVLAGFGRVFELVVRVYRVHVIPAVGLELFDDVRAVPVCGYMQHTRIHNK